MMRTPYRNRAMIVVVGMALGCLGLFPQHSLAEDSPQVVEGSSVTVLFHVTVPGEKWLEVKDVGRFVQGEHQLLPALEREVTGMKTGEQKKVQLSEEDGFGSYDVKKQKTVPRTDLPAGTKEGDVLQDSAGKSATVTRLSDQFAVIDYNHPLAGKPVVVELKILRVENPY